MPVLTLYKYRVEELLGREIDVDTLENWLPWLALDIEDKGSDYIKIEYNPNRPDFGTPPGILRGLKGIMGIEKGPPKYSVKESDIEVFVDESVKLIRPYILCALVKGVKLREDYLEEIIEFQEDLHIGIGRNRRKMAIGLHDADKVIFPVRYTTVEETFSFIPLEYDSELSIKEILDIHPKGKKYSYIYSGVDKYPIILDSENKVLSFPPIINGIYTQLTPDTRNIFIDVTGVDLKIVMQTMNLLTTTLAEYGGEIFSTKIIYPWMSPIISPKYVYNHIRVSIPYIKSILGLDLDLRSILDSIEKARLGVASYDDNEVEVVIPPYRVDIMHPVDVIEDVMIGYGLWKIKPIKPPVIGMGRLDENANFKNNLSLIMIGQGFQEVINPVLTNKEEQFNKMNIPAENYIEVESPKSLLYSMLRKWLIPRLLTNLYRSKDEEYPQRIFEIGEVVYREEGVVREEMHLAAVVAGIKEDYTIIKSVLDGFMEALGINNYRIVETKHPSFIPGRVGKILVNNVNDVGLIGEIHPSVILNFQLSVPIAAFELNIDKLYKAKEHI